MEESTMEITKKMWILIALASVFVGAATAGGIGAVQLYRAAAAKQLAKTGQQQQQNAK
jgi:hypothetical protein